MQSGVQRYVQNLLLHLDTAKYRVTLSSVSARRTRPARPRRSRRTASRSSPCRTTKKDRIRALAAHLRTHKDYDIIHYHTASKIGAPVCGMMRVSAPG